MVKLACEITLTIIDEHDAQEVLRRLSHPFWSLSLISETVYGVPPSYHDPARYSFAHGSKDGIPYPVDRTTYDQNHRNPEKSRQQSKALPNRKTRRVEAVG